MGEVVWRSSLGEAVSAGMSGASRLEQVPDSLLSLPGPQRRRGGRCGDRRGVFLLGGTAIGWNNRILTWHEAHIAAPGKERETKNSEKTGKQRQENNSIVLPRVDLEHTDQGSSCWHLT